MDVQAGGVRGGIMEKRSDRTPRPIAFSRFGMIPFRMSGSSREKVAPSHPMSNSSKATYRSPVFLLVSLCPPFPGSASSSSLVAGVAPEDSLRDSLEMLVEELHEFVYPNVPHLSLPDLGQELCEGQGAPIVLLHVGAENHDIDRFKAEVFDEIGFPSDRVTVFPVFGQGIEESNKIIEQLFF
jgi:hypothetical protein